MIYFWKKAMARPARMMPTHSANEEAAATRARSGVTARTFHSLTRH